MVVQGCQLATLDQRLEILAFSRRKGPKVANSTRAVGGSPYLLLRGEGLLAGGADPAEDCELPDKLRAGFDLVDAHPDLLPARPARGELVGLAEGRADEERLLLDLVGHGVAVAATL